MINTICFASIIILILSLVVYIYYPNEYYAGNVTVSNISTLDPVTYPPYQYNCVEGGKPYVDWCMYG
jgi:hypothetical protein